MYASRCFLNIQLHLFDILFLRCLFTALAGHFARHCAILY